MTFLTIIFCHRNPCRNPDLRLFLNGYLKPFVFWGVYLITVILSAFRFFKEINHSTSLLAGRTFNNNSTLWKNSHFPDRCLAQCKKVKVQLDSKRDVQTTKGDGHFVPGTQIELCSSLQCLIIQENKLNHVTWTIFVETSS